MPIEGAPGCDSRHREVAVWTIPVGAGNWVAVRYILAALGNLVSSNLMRCVIEKQVLSHGAQTSVWVNSHGDENNILVNEVTNDGVARYTDLEMMQHRIKLHRIRVM